jgi:hypothetical protein
VSLAERSGRASKPEGKSGYVFSAHLFLAKCGTEFLKRGEMEKCIRQDHQLLLLSFGITDISKTSKN